MPPDTNTHGNVLTSFTVASRAGATPVDYDGTPSVTLPIPNPVGLNPTNKFTHELLDTSYYNGSAHDNVMASDGSYYFCTGNQGSDTNDSYDLFTVGDFSGPHGQSYKPAIGWVSADGLTFAGPPHQPSCGGRSFFRDIDLDENGGKVCACGYGYTGSGGTMDFFDPDGPGPIARTNLNTATFGDAKGFAVVYDTATWAVLRTVIWESTYGDDFCTDITVTPDGGFVLVGQTRGSLGGNVNPAAGTNDGYMERYNADGSRAWSYQTETSVSDTFGDVTVDPDDGSIYVSGNRSSGTDNDPILMKFRATGDLVWTTAIDNGDTVESQRDHANIGKHAVFVLGEHNPSTGKPPWTNTISYEPQGTDEVLLQKLSPGDFDNGSSNGTPDGVVDFDDVQYAGSLAAPGLAGVDTCDFDGDGDSTLLDAHYMISNVMDRLVGDLHPGAMPQPLSDVDNADIGRVIGGYTGPGDSGKLYLDGDIDFDGDVDDDDVAYVVGAFGGARPSAGESPTNQTGAELIYSHADGRIWMSAWKAPGGIVTSFQVENTAGTFMTSEYVPPSVGSFGGSLEDVTPNVLGDTDLTFTGFDGTRSLGKCFPPEMDKEEFETYVTTAVYTGEPGSGQQPFKLVYVSGPSNRASVLVVR